MTTKKTKTKEKPTAGEKVPAITTLDLPLSILEAGLLCVDEDRPTMAGIFVHRVKEHIRAVATDGTRMLVQSMPVPTGDGVVVPEWLEDGVIVPVDRLKPRLSLIASAVKTHAWARLGYAKGAPKLELADCFGESLFRLVPVDSKYPDYQRIIGQQVDGFSSGLEVPTDFEPVSFSGAILKGVNDVAKALGAKAASMFMARPKRGEDGKVATCDATVCTFLGAPGAVLYIMPMNIDVGMNEHTATILQPAIKATVDALKKHQAQNAKWAKEATDDEDRKRFNETADQLKHRIAAIMSKTAPKALPAPDKGSAATEELRTDEERRAELIEEAVANTASRVQKYIEEVVFEGVDESNSGEVYAAEDVVEKRMEAVEAAIRTTLDKAEDAVAAASMLAADIEKTGLKALAKILPAEFLKPAKKTKPKKAPKVATTKGVKIKAPIASQKGSKKPRKTTNGHAVS